MRNLLPLLVAALLALSSAAANAGERPLRVAVNNHFPPLSWVAEGPSLVGFNVDVAEALCVAMERACEMQAVGMGDRVPGLMLKRFDVLVTPLSPNEPWAKAVALTAPYIRTGSVFLAREGFGGEVSSDTLKGKRVAVKRNAPHEAYVREHFGNDVEVEEAYSFGDAFNALADGDADLAFVPVFPALQFLREKDGKGFRLTGPTITEGRFGGGLHIAVRKDQPNLHAALEKALADILGNGTWSGIAASYFPEGVRDAVTPRP